MNIDDRITQMISDISLVRPDKIRAQDRLREDLGLDSVSSMELLSMLSEELHLDIEMEDALAVHTVAEVITMAKERLDVRAL